MTSLRLTFVLVAVASIAFFAKSEAGAAAVPLYRSNVSGTSFTAAQIETYMRDPALVLREIACVLRRGPCDQIGENIKLAIPEVITRNCARCTPQQAAGVKKLIEFIQRNHPGVMQQVRRMYNG